MEQEIVNGQYEKLGSMRKRWHWRSGLWWSAAEIIRHSTCELNVIPDSL